MIGTYAGDFSQITAYGAGGKTSTIQYWNKFSLFSMCEYSYSCPSISVFAMFYFTGGRITVNCRYTIHDGLVEGLVGKPAISDLVCLASLN